jgi:4-hydroxy-tetrahydrodipicolinate reductase
VNASGVVRVALVGLGPIGIEVARALVLRPGVAILGAADPAPDKAGSDLGVLLAGRAIKMPVFGDASELYARSQSTRGPADVALLCTGSRLAQVEHQILQAIDAGLHVISTCEELAFPYLRAGKLAQRLDARARERKVAILGTGINPGMVMDRLPLAVAAACVRVEQVRVRRVVDVALRRGTLQRKVGAGLTEDEFHAGVAQGRLGHVGLGESAALVARGLRAPLDDVSETIEPVVADVEQGGVAKGRVLGLRQRASAVSAGREIVTLDLQMSVNAQEPHDHISIDGDPPVDVLIRGGFHGDRATVGTVVNAIPYVLSGPPGLRTVLSLPLFGVFPIREMTPVEEDT